MCELPCLDYEVFESIVFSVTRVLLNHNFIFPDIFSKIIYRNGHHLVSSVHVVEQIVIHFCCTVGCDFSLLRHLFTTVSNMKFCINDITMHLC